jgi:hypothetical protein
MYLVLCYLGATVRSEYRDGNRLSSNRLDSQAYAHRSRKSGLPNSIYTTC